MTPGRITLPALLNGTHGRTAHATTDALRLRIREHVLRTSRYIQTPNFARISARDLNLLLEQYDAAFFDGHLRQTLTRIEAWPMPMKLNGRLRSTGGRTIRIRDRRTKQETYEIEISSAVLFENFRTPEDTAEVTGLACTDRLDALMRVMEHELLHLAEFLAFGESNCAAERFQSASLQLFGHRAHQHAMVTRRQKTLRSTSFRPGHRVRFEFEGRPMVGVINRINHRATILVEHASGVRYTNGKRYLKYYIPIPSLSRVEPA